MTGFEILIFGLALLAGLLAAAAVQAWARGTAKALGLVGQYSAYEEQCRELGIPFYHRSRTLEHVAVFPSIADDGDLWVVCDSVEHALAFLEPSWRELSLGQS